MFYVAGYANLANNINWLLSVDNVILAEFICALIMLRHAAYIIYIYIHNTSNRNINISVTINNNLEDVAGYANLGAGRPTFESSAAII